MKKGKLLFVDDEPHILEIFVEAFESEYEVLTALDGREGLMKIEKFDPDLVMTDINMPHLGGIEFLETIRKGNDHRPVIVFSAYGDMKNINRAIQAGAFDFLEKPINFIQVEISIRSAFDLIDFSVVGQARFLALKDPSNVYSRFFEFQLSKPIRDANSGLEKAMRELAELSAKLKVENDRVTLANIGVYFEQLKNTFYQLDESQKGFRRRLINQNEIKEPLQTQKGPS